MLSSPRWTYPDTLLLLLFVLVAGRVLGPDGGHGHAREEASSPVIEARNASYLAEVPMRAPSQLRPTRRFERVDIALRCLGLAEAARLSACREKAGPVCRSATRDLKRLERRLWPKGRDGQFAMARRGRIGDYARAYTVLSGRAFGAERRNSEFILQRDNAMCNRYREHFEVRLYGSKDRQPG